MLVCMFLISTQNVPIAKILTSEGLQGVTVSLSLSTSQTLSSLVGLFFVRTFLMSTNVAGISEK